MNEDNKERPFSKLVLEIGPLIIFFLCYYKAPIPENIVNDIDAANLFKIIFATKIFHQRRIYQISQISFFPGKS